MHLLPPGMSNPQPEPESRERRAFQPVVANGATPAGATPSDTTIAMVESLTHDGRGVARIAGKATFIQGALPGERVRFRYHNKRARYDIGITEELLEPSPDRAGPPCGYFGVCGGCSLQHMAAPAQVRAKERVLAETLEHIGRLAPDQWLPPIAESSLGYRRRARLGVRFVEKKGGVLVGFRERRHSYITPLAACLTLDPRLSKLLPSVRGLISRLSRPDQIPQVEVSAGDNACALVFRHLKPLTPQDYMLLCGFARDYGVGVYLQPGDPRTVHPLWPESGTELAYGLPGFGLMLTFGPTDFIQVNAAANRVLVERAVALLDLKPTERVLDLFCGLGNFTLPLARRAGWVVGCEGDPLLVQRGRENARRNDVRNAEFEIVDLYRSADSRFWTGGRYDKLLLDPPRAGAMEAIKSMAARGPHRIVYVSCNPATLARDSAYLVQVLGYRLQAAGVADMFPHTSHIESMALFTRA